MKTPTLLLATLLALGTSGQIVAQDSKAPKDDDKPARTETNSKAALPLPFDIAPPGKSEPAASTISSSVISLNEPGISTNAVVVRASSNRLDLIESGRLRLEGSAVPAVKRPSLVTFFQLFNPFAPAEYGGTHVTPASQGFGRVFADPVKTGPSTVLISVGVDPPKAEVPVKTSSD